MATEATYAHEDTITALCATCRHALEPTADGDRCASCGGTDAVISVEFTEGVTVTFGFRHGIHNCP